MIAAVVLLSVALAGAIALIAWQSYRNAKVDDLRDKWHADAVASDSSLIVANANAKSEYLRAESERKRADGLYDQLTKFRQALANPQPCVRCGLVPDLSGFVLSLWADDEQTNPNRDGARAVHTGSDPAPSVLSDDLINPEG